MKSVLRISVAFYLLLTTNQLVQAQEWLVFTSANSPIAFNGASDLCSDPEGNLWCISGQSVHRYSNRQGMWTKFRYDSAFVPRGNALASGLLVRRDGTPVVSTDSGFFAFTGNKWERMIKLSAGYGLAEDKDGAIWYYISNTLYKLHNGILSPLTSGAQIWDLHIDTNDHKWIADRDGVGRHDGVFWKRWGSPGSEDVRTLTSWRPNTIWTGTHTGLGFIRNDTAFWGFATSPPLPSIYVQCVYANPDGRLWIGTQGGVAIYDGNAWEYLTVSNSELPGHLVVDICADVFGNTWIATNQGIAAYRKGGVVSVHSPSTMSLPELTMWPTPAVDLININARGVRARADITVCDLLGRVVSSAIVEQDGVRQVDVSRLTPGSYFMRLATGTTVITRPFVKL